MLFVMTSTDGVFTNAIDQLEASGEVLTPAVRRVILALEARIHWLERRAHELEARLSQDSTNSSRPPSADPPGTQRPGKGERSGRQRGSQPGHPGHHRQMLAPERIDEVVEHRPATCGRCGQVFAGQQAAVVGKSTRHQLIELESYTVSDKLHLVLPGAHELRCIGTLGNALQDLRVDFPGNGAWRKLFFQPGVQFKNIGMRILKSLRQLSE